MMKKLNMPSYPIWGTVNHSSRHHRAVENAIRGCGPCEGPPEPEGVPVAEDVAMEVRQLLLLFFFLHLPPPPPPGEGPLHRGVRGGVQGQRQPAQQVPEPQDRQGRPVLLLSILHWQEGRLAYSFFSCFSWSSFSYLSSYYSLSSFLSPSPSRRTW